MSRLNRFFDMKSRLYYYRIALKTWKKYHAYARAKKRNNAYNRNFMYRKRLSRLFKNWFIVSHNWGKERISLEEQTFKNNLEREKLTMWTSKVDQLMLYMA